MLKIPHYAKPQNDDTQSATLLAYHRPGGFHRPMSPSHYADWRTSDGFVQCLHFRIFDTSSGTAQSRRGVGNKLKNITIQIKMTDTEKIKQVIIDFVKGGDNSDVQLLDKVLHKDFRITNNGFMGTSGVTIIDKKEYLNNIKSGVFGGLPRKMEIEQLDQSGKIASVKLRIESAENDFLSYNSLVLDTDNQWKIINNLAVVKPKK